MPFSSDEQRKAVMAKLHGGGGGSGRSPRSPGSPSVSGLSDKSAAVAGIGGIYKTGYEGVPLDDSTPGAASPAEIKGPKSPFIFDTSDLMMLAITGTGGSSVTAAGKSMVGKSAGFAKNLLTKVPTVGLSPNFKYKVTNLHAREAIAKGLAKAVAGFGGAAAISEYRRDHSLTERQDHALALLQRGLETLGAYGTGQAVIGAGKGLLGRLEIRPASKWNVAPTVDPNGPSLDPLTGKMRPGVAKWVEKSWTDPVKSAGWWLYDKYNKWAGITGGDWSKMSIAALKPSGFIALLAGGVQTAEQIVVSKAEKDAYAAFKAGVKYDSPGTVDVFDSGAKLAAMAAIGTLGNPVEKLSRYYNDGSFTSALYQRGAVRAMETILEENRAGMTDAEYEKARADINERLPNNMAGRSIDIGTSALNAFIRWQASDVRERVRLPDSSGKISGIVDGDTVLIKHPGSGDAKSTRLADVNAPEVAHPEHGKEYGQYWGEEAKALAAKLAPVGSPVKLLQDPDQPTEKWGRDIGNIEVPANALQRAVWSISPALDPFPGKDLGQAMIEAGAVQPGKYRMLQPNSNIREMDYDRAMAKAQAAKVGMYGTGRESTKMDIEKAQSVPAYALRVPSTLETISTGSGASLMYTGNSGVFQLGKAGSAIAQLWNAGQSILGTAQHAQQGPRYPAPKVIKLPKSVPVKFTASGDVDASAAWDAFVRDYRGGVR